MGVAIVGFVFPHTLQSLLEESFTDKIIQTYREDPDLQNFIDFGQQEVRMELSNDNKYIFLYQVIEFCI
jgi:tetraspanin-33